MLTPTDVHYLVGLLTLVSSPEDVEIKLGDLVYDVTADEDRDVDVTVTYKDADGSISVFKGIEVKKHRRPLNVTHVEQLAAKLNDMPSMNHRAIVSSSGYTKPAQRKAEAHGIELFSLVDWENTMEGFQHVRFAPWLEGQQTILTWASMPSVSLKFNYPPSSEPQSQITPDTPICDASGKVPIECTNIHQFIERLKSDALISIGQEESIQEIAPGIVKSVDINVSYDEQIYAVLKDEKLQLKAVAVKGEVKKISANLNPVFKILVRVGESKPFVGCAIAELCQGSLIGITASQVDRGVNLIHIPLSDRNRKKIQRHRLR